MTQPGYLGLRHPEYLSAHGGQLGVRRRWQLLVQHDLDSVSVAMRWHIGTRNGSVPLTAGAIVAFHHRPKQRFGPAQGGGAPATEVRGLLWVVDLLVPRAELDADWHALRKNNQPTIVGVPAVC